jgi:hypothetical protein
VRNTWGIAAHLNWGDTTVIYPPSAITPTDHQPQIETEKETKDPPVVILELERKLPIGFH